MQEQIAERVRRYRESLGYNQREAAVRAGLSFSMWQRIEAGTKEPTLGQLSAVAHALGRTLESLTDTSPVRERLVFAPRLRNPKLNTEEEETYREVTEHLAYLLEVDAHLRYVGVGQHA